MKILLLDIETAPNLAYVWGLFKENIPIARIVDSGYVMCWAAKWYGESDIMFDSVVQSRPRKMLQQVHDLLDAADVVVHYNGHSFDIPTLNKEFVTHGMSPPAPYKQVDLYRTVKDKFRFPSNKMEYVLNALKLGGKEKHEGFELWVKCMNRDETAWRTMKRYNIGDVTQLEKMYVHLLPWITNHPNRSAYSERPVCTNCGVQDAAKRGFTLTRQSKYQRYQCNGCGSWFRGSKPVATYKGERMVAIV